MLAKDMQAPRLRMDDVIVLREAGSNTLSLFSRHCSRLAPPVLGYRLAKDQNEVEELVVLKSQEDLASLCGFWGGEVSREVASSLCDAENAPSPKKAKL